MVAPLQWNAEPQWNVEAPSVEGGPYRTAVVEPPAAPFEPRELWAAAWRPQRFIRLVLVERARLSATLSAERHLLAVAGMLASGTVLASLPLGAVLWGHWSDAWRLPVLFLGSLGVSVPSLHVFACYLGWRRSLAHNVVTSMLVTAVAAMFALGFAPIVWFVDVSTASSSSSSSVLGAALLCTALFAGMVHHVRTAGALPSERRVAYGALVVLWQLLLFYVTLRMAVFLGLS